MKIIVACGGTGGHTFPGLAVAKALLAKGHEVIVWTSGRDVEKSVMKSWEGPVFATGAKQLKPKFAFAIMASYFRCRRELKRQQPNVLLAMGSYASLPPVLAARSRGIPVVLHEANTVPGKAVEFLSRYAKVVATSFAMTEKYIKRAPCELTGLPIRNEISQGQRFDFIPENAFVVMVTGGSQGAHRVNELTSQAMVLVKKSVPLYVIHQTGMKDEAEVAELYHSQGIPCRVHGFEHEMANAFKSANLVIARAGASTCFEIAACGKPVMFIPLPSAMKNHQHFNADAFVSIGAADEGIQADLSPKTIARYIERAYEDKTHTEAMAAKILTLATPDAAEKVAELVIKNARQ